MKDMQRRKLAFVMVAVLALAACGGDGDSSSSSDSAAVPDDAPASPSVSNSSDPASSESPATAGEEPSAATSGEATGDSDVPWGEGGELTVLDVSSDWAEDGQLTYLAGTNAASIYDPHTATNPFVNVFLYPAYDRLVWIDPTGSLHPMLATEWSFSEDGTALNMSLREGVSFHDGEPFDAEAVKANIERGKSLETSTVKANLAAIDSVDVVDTYEVRFNLSAPAGALPAFFADRAGMMISPAAFDNEDLDLLPVGAGPFKVVNHEPGTVISFERFEDYWDPGSVRLKNLDIRMQLDADTRLSAIRGGEVDATVLDPGSAQEETAESSGLDVTREFSTTVWTISLNKVVNPALGETAVRQAMNVAIDRDLINEALLGGVCPPAVQAFSPDWWPHNPDISADFYAYDPDRARALLAEGGFPDGFDLEFTVANVPTYVAMAEAIQAQWAEVGINANLSVLEPAELLSRFLQEQTLDASLNPLPGGVDPAGVVNLMYSGDAAFNPGGFSVPEIERLAMEGQEGTTPDDRAASYQELAQVAVDEALQIHLCLPPVSLAAKPDVQDLHPNIVASAEDFHNVSRAAN